MAKLLTLSNNWLYEHNSSIWAFNLSTPPVTNLMFSLANVFFTT